MRISWADIVTLILIAVATFNPPTWWLVAAWVLGLGYYRERNE